MNNKKDNNYPIKNILDSVKIFNTIFEKTSKGLGVYDLEGNIIQTNKTCQAFLGYTDEEISSLTLKDITHADSYNIALKNFKDLASGKIESWQADQCLVSKQGQKYWARITRTLIRDDDNNPLYILCMGDNITDLIQAEKKKTLYNSLLEELSSLNDFNKILNNVCKKLQQEFNYNAVGIRLKYEDDFPYIANIGFSDKFIEKENYLCNGNKHPKCMCGNVISGNIDQSKSYFTTNGSFWTNNTTEFINSSNETNTHNTCNKEGYESVALIPLRNHKEIIGLIQFNNFKPNKFNHEKIYFLEQISNYISSTILKNKFKEKLIQEKEYLEKTVIKKKQDLQKTLLELEESHTLFNAISKTALDAIIVINSTGKVIYWSEAAKKIFGYTFDEIQNKNLHEIIAPSKYNEAFKNGLMDFKLNGTGNAIGKTVELEAINNEGELFDVELSLSSIKIKNEWHAVGIVRDISERKKIENDILSANNLLKEKNIELKESKKQLEIANKHKDKFLSIMSHELRTPLNAVIGFSQVLERQYSENLSDQQIEYISLINESGKHLLNIINDILDISRIDTGSMTVSIKKIHLNELFDIVIAILKQPTKMKNIFLDYYIEENISFIEGDAQKCKQILINLLNNAIKFTPPKGKITLSAEKFNDNNIKISVIDNGIGIEETYINKIFQEFYQAKPIRDKTLGGLGLGLALCKRLVELQNGTIGVESKYNEGSTFWFTLPICNDDNYVCMDDY